MVLIRRAQGSLSFFAGRMTAATMMFFGFITVVFAAAPQVTLPTRSGYLNEILPLAGGGVANAQGQDNTGLSGGTLCNCSGDSFCGSGTVYGNSRINGNNEVAGESCGTGNGMGACDCAGAGAGGVGTGDAGDSGAGDAGDSGCACGCACGDGDGGDGA